MTDAERREKNRLKSQKWRETHPGYSTQKTRELREKDPHYWRRWAESHRDNLRAADLRYQKKDPSQYRKVKRLAKRKSREKHPDRDAIACLKWRIKKILA